MFILTLAMLGAAIYFMIKAHVAVGFHYRGKGEMQGRAAFARTRRQNPSSSDAQLSEPEFVEKFIKKGPKVWLNIAMALFFGILFVITGLGATLASVAGH